MRAEIIRKIAADYFRVSSVLDPIGDRNDVYIGHPLIGGPPIPGRGGLAMPRTGPGIEIYLK